MFYDFHPKSLAGDFSLILGLFFLGADNFKSYTIIDFGKDWKHSITGIPLVTGADGRRK